MENIVVHAHVPTWLRIKLFEAQRGGRKEEGCSYVDVGYHLGRYHLEDFCADEDHVFNADQHEVMRYPTTVLRRIFKSDEHPRGELTDLIPLERRREFLIGVLAGAGEDEPGAGWLSLVE